MDKNDSLQNRRAFLRRSLFTLVAATLSATVPIGTGVAIAQKTRQQTRKTQVANPTYYRFNIGNFECLTITDGILNAPSQVLAVNAPKEELAQVLRDSFQPAENLPIHCNILFVNTGRNRVLIDTGSGLLGGASVGKLVANLQGVGISPASIDTIILTHAHSDHIGGLADKNGRFVFPKARYYINRAEYDFWMSPNASLPKLGAGTDMAKKMLATAKKGLTQIRDRVTKFEPGKEFIPGFTAISAFGHTPGHTVIQITSNQTSLIHLADTVFNPAITLWHPEWQVAFDADPEQALLTRQRILSEQAKNRNLVFAYHFPFPGIGHIRQRNQGGFEWQPQIWQF